MKKILKRLATGFLAFATIVTALPTTAVHASQKQYWTESAERVGIVEKVMNDGSIGSTFNEGHTTVEGEDAFCVDINTNFRNGYKTRADASTRMSYDQISDVALSIEYVNQYVQNHSGLSSQHMLHEDYGHYKYTEHYYLGDVFVYTSQDEEKGTLLELKGKGCRQFESYLLAQERSWYDFLMDALVEGGVMKRLDLAINDRAGILDIPDLTAKCNRVECVSLFRSFKSYASGELVKHNEQDKAGMGHTLYIGSLKSEVYFCCYEKNYEQYAKLGIPIEEAPIKNRFEIRLKDERAYYAVRELLTHYDAEQTAFSIINHYIRFVDREPEKRKTDWKLNDRWAWFIGKDRPPIKLTTDPEPYTLERTLGWISRQVAPTLKMLKKIDAGNSTSYLKEIEDNAKLTEKHAMRRVKFL